MLATSALRSRQSRKKAISTSRASLLLVCDLRQTQRRRSRDPRTYPPPLLSSGTWGRASIYLTFPTPLHHPSPTPPRLARGLLDHHYHCLFLGRPQGSLPPSRLGTADWADAPFSEPAFSPLAAPAIRGARRPALETPHSPYSVHRLAASSLQNRLWQRPLPPSHFPLCPPWRTLRAARAIRGRTVCHADQVLIELGIFCLGPWRMIVLRPLLP